MYTGKYEDQHIIFENMKTKEKKDHPLHKYIQLLFISWREDMNLRRWYRAEFDTFPVEDFIYFG